MGKITNSMHLTFDAKSVNEAFARMTVMAFMADMNPTLDEMEDVKTAVSEAVTNAIIHGYNDESKQVEMCCIREGQKLTVLVIKAWEYQTWKRRDSPFTLRSLSRSVQEWDLRLWRLSWMESRLILRWE